jgi:hypothetical protein
VYVNDGIVQTQKLSLTSLEELNNQSKKRKVDEFEDNKEISKVIFDGNNFNTLQINSHHVYLKSYKGDQTLILLNDENFVSKKN